MADLSKMDLRAWKWAQGSHSGYIRAADLQELQAFLAGAPEGRTAAEIAVHLNVPNLSHRKADKSLQLLRRFGLARYDNECRRWVAAGGTGKVA